MNNERLERLEALANAATDGPWKLGYSDGSGKDDCVISLGIPVFHADALFGIGEDDIKFIAASRTAIPELIAEVRRLRQLNDKGQRARDALEEKP
jgi:hypothetical protein